MEKYTVTIYETNTVAIDIEAENAEQARAIARKRWEKCDPVIVNEMEFYQIVMESEPSPRLGEPITVLYVPVNGPPEARIISNDFLQIWHMMKDDYSEKEMDEEGLIVYVSQDEKSQPLNRVIYDENHQIKEAIFGDFFICSRPWDKGYYGSLRPEQIKKYKEWLKNPEKITWFGCQLLIEKLKTKDKEPSE